MKFLKKLFAFAIAFAMLFSLGTRVMAADGDEDEPTPPNPETPLTVTGLEEDDIAYFYQVIEWNPEAEDSVAGWVAVEPFDTVLTPTVLKDVLVGTPAVPDDPDTDEDESQDAVPPTGITAELAGQLARAAKNVVVPEANIVTVDAEGTATFSNTKAVEGVTETIPGMWMVLVTPIDVDTVYNPVFVSSDFTDNESYTWEVEEGAATYSDKAAAKKSVTELNKDAEVDDDTSYDLTWTSTRIGETVHYTVTTTIPGYGTLYEEPFFKVGEHLTNLDLITETVTIVAPADLEEDDDYTLEADEEGFSIVFSSAYLKTVKTPTDVEITYDAVVSTDAPLHVNEEQNEVWTEYSHDPTDETDHKFKRDTTQHYTYTIDAEGIGPGSSEEKLHTSEIVKVGRDAAGNPITETTEHSEITKEEYWESPLEGAVFGLYTDEKCENAYYPLVWDEEAGKYVTSDEPAIAASGADGRMTFAGLDAGTYWLDEISAPPGFIKDPNCPVEVVITPTFTEVELTEYTTDGETWISEEEYEDLDDDKKADYKSSTFKTDVLESYTVTIDGEDVAVYHYENEGTHVKISTEIPPVELPHEFVNTQGTELPSTGGMGTTLFYTIGGMLVIGAGILLVSRRRMAE